MKTCLFILFTFGYLLCSVAGNTTPENVYIVSENVGANADISSYAKIFVDSGNIFTIDEILQGDADHLFGVNAIYQNIWKRHPKTYTWGKLFIYNPFQNAKQVYLRIALEDTTYVYYRTGNTEIKKLEFGYLIKEKRTMFPGIKLNIPANDTLEVYFNAIGDEYYLYDGPHYIDISEQDRLWKLISEERIFYGIFYGILLALVFYSTAIYFAVRESVYLFFIVALISFGIYFLDTNQIGPIYLWNNEAFYKLDKYGNLYLFSVISSVSAFLFFRKFLELKTEFPKFDKIFLFLIACEAIIYLSFLVGRPDLFRSYNNLLGLVLQLILLILAIILLFRKKFAARIFLIAFSIPMICAMINQLLLLQAPNKGDSLGTHLFQTGVGFAFIAFSIGVGTNIRLINREKRRAEANALQSLKENEKLIKEQNILLEHKVEERTKDLKNAQYQLIQTEKLASLGQLTAGIAHEIKNPLNFVNNFSQLSNELIDEFVLAKTDEEKNEILHDIKINLKKINEHGKRADSIVKNMLQHSRSGTGERQLTNMNELCNEFVNLTFHGMRSTHPEFNCKIEKQFDPALQPMLVIAQDISRVLINLFNNAFYAVYKRNISEAQGYEPIVTISTETSGNNVYIRVRDNGAGIPESIKQKIFEPFFTTKATGEGTGLGLSLSYDIIKAHGGILKLENVDSGAEFIIQLPVEN